LARKTETVGVVGLGTMGAGIAQLAIEAGFETFGREVSMELAEMARGRIAHFLTRKVEKGQLEQSQRDAAVERLLLTTDVSDLAGCDLIVEAIVEELEPKRELFAELDREVAVEGLGDPQERVDPRRPARIHAYDYSPGLFGSGHERSVRARFAAARPSARLGR
jgi:3-hydroxybutyryl-CoA dehydrogenase